MDKSEQILELITKIDSKMEDGFNKVYSTMHDEFGKVYTTMQDEFSKTHSTMHDEFGKVYTTMQGEFNKTHSTMHDEFGKVYTTMQNEFNNVYAEFKDIQMTLENETNKNIQLIAEGHFDLKCKLDDALKIENEKELMLIRITRLENEVRRLKSRIEEIA